MAVLGLFRPFKELHLSQVIPNIVIPSVFRSSNWSSYIWLPFIYFLYNAGFRPSIYVSVPAQVFRQLELQFQTLLRRVSRFEDYLSHSDLVPHKTITSTRLYKMIASYPFQSPYINNLIPLTNDE